MKKIKIDTEQIKDWDSFHELFSKTFDFPEYYGRNMDAWIDCMDEFTTELTILDLGDCRTLKETQPEIIEALHECSAFVNYRRNEANENPALIISMLT